MNLSIDESRHRMLITQPNHHRAYWIPIGHWALTTLLTSLALLTIATQPVVYGVNVWPWVTLLALVMLCRTLYITPHLRATDEILRLHRLVPHTFDRDEADVRIRNAARGQWRLRIAGARRAADIMRVDTLHRAEAYAEKISDALQIDFVTSTDHQRAENARQPYRRLARVWYGLLLVTSLALAIYVVATVFS